MKSFRILAQSFTSSRRIEKVVQATDADSALRSVWAELEDAGFYPLGATEV
jgi:hypothetical protein